MGDVYKVIAPPPVIFLTCLLLGLLLDGAVSDSDLGSWALPAGIASVPSVSEPSCGPGIVSSMSSVHVFTGAASIVFTGASGFGVIFGPSSPPQPTSAKPRGSDVTPPDL